MQQHRTGSQTLQSTLGSLSVTAPQPSASKPASSQPSSPVCEVCDGIGFLAQDLPVGHPQFGKLLRCECKAQEDAARLQRLSGLTETERRARLEDIDATGRPGTQAMINACREFLLSPFGSLVLHGTSGNAKTVALQSVVNELVRSNVEAVYITAFDLIGYIRDAFNEQKEVKSESAYDRVLRFGTVPFLAIDEFDKLKVTDWITEQITDLIDRRYRLGLDGQAGTMLAMNGKPENLPMWIYSRLSQGVIVRNDDSDLRSHLK